MTKRFFNPLFTSYISISNIIGFFHFREIVQDKMLMLLPPPPPAPPAPPELCRTCLFLLKNLVPKRSKGANCTRR